MDPGVPLTKGGYNDGIKRIHQNQAKLAVNSYTPALWTSTDTTPVPIIDPKEKTLPRTARCVLAQLRSGYSKILGSFKSKVDETADDRCPECGGTPHDVLHLFNCPRMPAPPGLGVESLWTDPVGVAEFLKLTGDNNSSQGNP